VTTCPSCEAANAAEARFCSQCGVTLASRVAVEERRFVSVLFADLVGSTAVGARTDPEVMRGVIGRFFELAAQEMLDSRPVWAEIHGPSDLVWGVLCNRTASQ
jgi:class 3 adenylate cyclase